MHGFQFRYPSMKMPSRTSAGQAQPPPIHCGAQPQQFLPSKQLKHHKPGWGLELPTKRMQGQRATTVLARTLDSLCPEKLSAFKSMNLSFCTVCRRIEEMSESVNDSLKTCCLNFYALSLVLDVSNNVKDTDQLAIFIRGVTAALHVYEEFLQLVPLHGTTTGQDIFDAVLQCVKQQFLNLSHFVCVTTDGASAMTGKREGAASLLACQCEAAGHTQPIH